MSINHFGWFHMKAVRFRDRIGIPEDSIYWKSELSFHQFNPLGSVNLPSALILSIPGSRFSQQSLSETSDYTSLHSVNKFSMTNLKVFVAILTLAVVGLYTPIGVIATDSDPLQDFCIADLSAAAGPIVNGFPCTDPTLATTEDFAFSGLATAANLTGNILNGSATFGFVREWPALNTLGLGLARLDFNPGGIIMPHTHNLATEILFCIEGEIYTGFVTNSDNPIVPNKLYAKVVKKGEAFIFPRGLLHFQLNKGTVPAASINVLNGQNPGLQFMPVALFGTGVDPELLAKSFFISEKEVGSLASIFSQLVNLV